MITLQASEVINRPIEEVFAFATDPRNDVCWQDGLLEIRVTPDGPVAVGSRIIEVRKFMGRRVAWTGVVSEHTPNCMSARKTLSGPAGVEVEGCLAFEQVEGRTRITQRIEIRTSGLFAEAEPLLSSSLQRTLEKNFGELKELLEGDACIALQFLDVITE